MLLDDYTVLLLRPDYATASYGTDTYLAHVQALSVENAALIAQIEARDTDYPELEDQRLTDYEDYHVLAVFAGHLEDLKE